jgi:hypothetical protein
MEKQVGSVLHDIFVGRFYFFAVRLLLFVVFIKIFTEGFADG